MDPCIVDEDLLAMYRCQTSVNLLSLLTVLGGVDDELLRSNSGSRLTE